MKSAKLVSFDLNEPKPPFVGRGSSPYDVQVRRLDNSCSDERFDVALHDIASPFCAVLSVPVQDGPGGCGTKYVCDVFFANPDGTSADEVYTESLDCMQMQRTRGDFFGHKIKAALPPSSDSLHLLTSGAVSTIRPRMQAIRTFCTTVKKHQ